MMFEKRLNKDGASATSGIVIETNKHLGVCEDSVWSKLVSDNWRESFDDRKQSLSAAACRYP